MDSTLCRTVFILIIVTAVPVWSTTREQCQASCQANRDTLSRYQHNIRFLDGFTRYCLKMCQELAPSGTDPSTQPRPTTPQRTTPPPTSVKTTLRTSQPPFDPGSCGVSDIISSRIIGGSNARECELPWMVGIEVPNNWCGGSIIGPRHVLTAAHCMYNVAHTPLSYGEIKVKAGSSFLRELKSYEVQQINISPSYNKTNKDYDMAVITLKQPLRFSKCIKPLCLPEVNQRPEDTLGCTVAGWGTTYVPVPFPSERNQPPILQKVDVNIVDNDLCAKSYEQLGQRDLVNERRLCAGDYENGMKDSCGGDSGGPLMCLVRRNSVNAYVQFGIVSYGARSCGARYYPGGYLRVPHPEILGFIRTFLD